MNVTEEEIRQRAYAIWEAEGRPEGRYEQHWQQACQEAGPAEPAQNPDPVQTLSPSEQTVSRSSRRKTETTEGDPPA